MSNVSASAAEMTGYWPISVGVPIRPEAFTTPLSSTLIDVCTPLVGNPAIVGSISTVAGEPPQGATKGVPARWAALMIGVAAASAVASGTAGGSETGPQSTAGPPTQVGGETGTQSTAGPHSIGALVLVAEGAVGATVGAVGGTMPDESGAAVAAVPPIMSPVPVPGAVVETDPEETATDPSAHATAELPSAESMSR